MQVGSPLRHRDGGHRLYGRDHIGTRAAKEGLQTVSQHRRDAVHLDLRVTVMHHTIRLPLLTGLLELGEQRVKEGVVVVRQIDTVGVGLQIIAEETHTVQQVVGAGHLKTSVDFIEDFVHIHLFLGGGHISLIGGKMQRPACYGHSVSWEKEPAHAQQQQYGEYKK